MKVRLFYLIPLSLIFLFSSNTSLATLTEVTSFGKPSDEKTVSWEFSVPLINQTTGTVNFGINAVAKLGHHPTEGLLPGSPIQFDL
ncbi:MAG: hypothetical protein ACW981_15410 [Candidatus Hodarchaeales archaeon]|jgi:hypothetical protein